MHDVTESEPRVNIDELRRACDAVITRRDTPVWWFVPSDWSILFNPLFYLYSAFV